MAVLRVLWWIFKLPFFVLACMAWVFNAHPRGQKAIWQFFYGAPNESSELGKIFE